MAPAERGSLDELLELLDEVSEPDDGVGERAGCIPTLQLADAYSAHQGAFHLHFRKRLIRREAEPRNYCAMYKAVVGHEVGAALDWLDGRVDDEDVQDRVAVRTHGNEIE